jgi:outer membrane protein assembly factor BamB
MTNTLDNEPDEGRSPRSIAARGLGCALGAAVVLAVWFGVALFLLDLFLEPSSDPGSTLAGPFDPGVQGPFPASTMRGFEVGTGEPRWRRRFDSDTALVGVSGSVAVVHEQRGAVRAIDAQTGRDRWRQPTGASSCGPRLVGDVVVVRSSAPTVIAYDAESGTERWRLSSDQRCDRLVAAGDLLLVVARVALTETERQITAHDVQTGSLRWQVQVPGSDQITAQNGVGLVFDAFDDLIALDLATGARLWSRQSEETGAAWSGPTVAAGPTVGITSRTADEAMALPPQMRFVDPASGNERWATVIHPQTSFAFDAADNTLFEFNGGQLVARDPGAGGVRWETGAAYGRLLARDAFVYLANGFVRAFDGTDGTLRWSRLLREGVHATPAGISDTVLVVATDEGREPQPID